MAVSIPPPARAGKRSGVPPVVLDVLYAHGTSVHLLLPARVSVRAVAAAGFALAFAFAGCAASAGRAPPPASSVAAAPGRPAPPPVAVRVDPLSGGGASKPVGFAALEAELRRGMHDLSQKGKPPPYFIGYEVHDRTETTVMASYGALVQSTARRSRILDADVRVGDYKLDSTHSIKSSDFDFGSTISGHPVPLPLSDDPTALRAVAWSETDRRYEEAAERLVKITTQRTLKVADDDPSDDFSREKPHTYFGRPATLVVDLPGWETRLRRLSARFRGQPEILDSDVSLQATSLTRWLLSSEGTAIQTGRNYVRVYLEANARADDGMDLERFEGFDAETIDGLGNDAAMERAADAIIGDLKALRRAPLAEPFAGPAILEGKAAGVFFHEIFGHRVEGHRQKSDEEGQTFAKKIGEPVMPSFISVFDDPTLSRLDGVDLNGFYRFDDEGVDAQHATLVDGGILRGFLLSRSPTRGFSESNGHGRRQEGRSVVSRQGNLVVEPSRVVSTAELRELLIEEAKRQGKRYGLTFRDISGGFTNTARGGPQAFKVLPILVYRVWVDGRPDELVRGVDLVGTPLSALSKIMAAADDYQTFNGYCGAESGFVPVSATSPSLLVQQIETERRDKGSEKPPVLPPPPLVSPGAASAGHVLGGARL
jgi:TldD protein